MRSASPIRCRSMSTPRAPARSTSASSSGRCPTFSRCARPTSAAGFSSTSRSTGALRLGLQASAVDLATARLDDLPTPFAVVGGELPAYVVAAGRGGQWTVLDVVEGRVWQMTSADVRTLGARALVVREKLVREKSL